MSIYCNSLSELSRRKYLRNSLSFLSWYQSPNSEITSSCVWFLGLLQDLGVLFLIFFLCVLFIFYFFGPDLLVLVFGRVMSLEQFEHFLL